MKIEIRSRWDASVLFSIEAATLKLAVEAAVKSEADLSEADLSEADISKAKLSMADLSGADLSEANLSGANLSWADLSMAKLSRADLSWADLSWADLSWADLSWADLSMADLSKAKLSMAKLSGADLSGAKLSRANLSRADLSLAKGIDANRCTPLRMLLEQPGKIRAYKLVNEKMEGLYCRREGYSPITYDIGKSFEVKGANTDDGQECAAGINLATLDWCMREWVVGFRILVAEFTAADIAAIPIATDGKFRVHRCKIVGEKDLRELGLVKAEEMKMEMEIRIPTSPTATNQ